MDYDADGYADGAKRKIWQEDYNRKDRLRKTKPSWMLKYIWRQNDDRTIELKNGHDNEIGDHVDSYNYDRFRSYYDESELRHKITKASRYGGNKIEYKKGLPIHCVTA